MTAKLDIQGLGKLLNQMRGMQDVAKAKKIKTAAQAGMLIIVNDAKRRIRYKTGTARRSLHVGGATELTADFNPSEGYSDVGTGQEQATAVEVVGGTNIEYGPRLEYGYKGIDSLGRMYDQPAYPYLRPAFDTKRDAAVKEVAEALEILIDQEAAKS